MVKKKGKEQKRKEKRTWISGSQVRKRSLVITLCFTVLLMALCVRVGYLQFIEGAMYQEMATNQQTKTRVITAKRGTIYDRNGNTLAISATVYRVSINPRDIRNDENHKDDVEAHQKYVAQKLAEILEVDYQTVYKKVMEKNAYQEIKRKVEDDVIDVLQAWIKSEDIFGVYVDEDAKRYYPNNGLAAHVIGFTGTDDQGLSGIEAIYDEYLTGTNGYILSAVDAKQNALPLAEETRVEPEEGFDVTLTIDETIQYLVEKSIAKTAEDCNVLGGVACIVMNPHTGEILAIASNPSFNLNEPFAFPTGCGVSTGDFTEETWTGKTQAEVDILNSTVWRSKAISDTYEPGSTFKSISAAIYLEEGIATPGTLVDDTPLSFYNSTIRCWLRNNTANHGMEKFETALWNSCNPVFAKLAVRTGIPTYYKYIDAFGFKTNTGIRFPGEGTSIFHTNPTELDMAVTSFGQRFQVTPLQMATAYCALANGGELLVPQLVKTVTDADGNVVEKSEKTVVRQVISKETSKTVVDMLHGVVSEGTGSNAYIKGLRIAGKTGTSETLTTEIDGRYIASFIGIAPADDPEVVVAYIVDHPNVTPSSQNGGGYVAAPAAGKLIEEILNYLKVERIYSDKDSAEIKSTATVPNIEGKTISEAKKMLQDLNLNIKIVGDVEDETLTVFSQMPASGYLIPEDSNVVVYTSNGEPEMVEVPDLSGLSVNAALKKLNECNLCMKIYGKGTVIDQSYAPGTLVPIGTIITVDFRTFYAGAE